MIAKRLGKQSGYSLVEVMATIVILAIAILPMFAMFDMGLTAATRGGDHDKARALANQQLATAKSLPYDTVRNTFPNNTCNLGVGDDTCDPVTVADGFSYTITKEFLDAELVPVDPPSDMGVMRIEVTVSRDGTSYPPVSGVVSR